MAGARLALAAGVGVLSTLGGIALSDIRDDPLCLDTLRDVGVGQWQRPLSLVQLRSQARTARSAQRLGAGGAAAARARLRQSTASAADAGAAGVDCSRHPEYCTEKLDCQHQSNDNLMSAVTRRIATADGHANLKSWCLNYPAYTSIVDYCIGRGDLRAAAGKTFENALATHSDEADASYCYLAGLWNDTDVTDATDVSEMESICDRRFGERWKQVGLDEVLNAGIIDDDGFTTRHGAEMFAMMACAGGNYHCDVVYCKRNYCGKQLYQRFANLSWSY
mmetsp:Transcript_4627/g.13149  ORF Transcript_4627/g.13149 Transcript_4627/m.13149 type:complete len:278 (+) Transcript_4627:3-836(+)